jgi:hypothetical protein
MAEADSAIELRNPGRATNIVSVNKIRKGITPIV